LAADLDFAPILAKKAQAHGILFKILIAIKAKFSRADVTVHHSFFCGGDTKAIQWFRRFLSKLEGLPPRIRIQNQRVLAR